MYFISMTSLLMHPVFLKTPPHPVIGGCLAIIIFPLSQCINFKSVKNNSGRLLFCKLGKHIKYILKACKHQDNQRIPWGSIIGFNDSSMAFWISSII